MEKIAEALVGHGVIVEPIGNKNDIEMKELVNDIKHVYPNVKINFVKEEKKALL